MSTKKKPSNQPKKLIPPQKSIETKVEVPVVETQELRNLITEPVIEQVYIPSDNADRYPIKVNYEYAYKLLVSRNDYMALQEDVTKHMNDGWKLAGGVSSNIYSDGYSVTTIWCQAIHKETSNKK